MPKLVVALLTLLLATTTAQACKVCRPKVEAAIHSSDYTANVLLLLFPIALLIGGALLLFFSPSLSLWKHPPPPSIVRP